MELCFSRWASLNMDYLQTLKYVGQPTTGIRLWPWPTYDELFSLSQVRVHWELSPVPGKTFIPPPDPSTCFSLTLPPQLLLLSLCISQCVILVRTSYPAGAKVKYPQRASILWSVSASFSISFCQKPVSGDGNNNLLTLLHCTFPLCSFSQKLLVCVASQNSFKEVALLNQAVMFVTEH